LGDAATIRNHLLTMFEWASQEDDPERLKALRISWWLAAADRGGVCGGALRLIRLVLSNFPELDNRQPGCSCWKRERLLAGFPMAYPRGGKTLRKKQVDVRFGATVADYDGMQVRLKSGESIPAYTLIWAAGVRAESLLERLGLPQARQGRVSVEPTLQVPGRPEVFVVGDAAYLEEDGQPLPMMAPVAIQQGKTAARNITLSGSLLQAFDAATPAAWQPSGEMPVAA
jgi:NADH dehydrogenase